jgi:hypothetical protein
MVSESFGGSGIFSPLMIRSLHLVTLVDVAALIPTKSAKHKIMPSTPPKRFFSKKIPKTTLTLRWKIPIDEFNHHFGECQFVV